MTPPHPASRPLKPRKWSLALALLCLISTPALAASEGSSTTGSGLSLTDSKPTGLTLPASLSTETAPGSDMEPLSPAATSSRAVTTLRPPTDLWERIRRGFAMPDLEGSLVQDSERLYSRGLTRMTERSRKYLFHVVEELERRGMPTELALLPFIESSYNPEAVSSAKAAGMWQFIPSTGKHFDLTQNAFRDDRRDVIESTRAALDYLQKLYDMFGDWQLALAAYNWGEGSVTKAIARNKAAGLGLSYKDLNMPNETRHYVPRLQAFKNLIAAPEGFKAKLPLIENHPYFQSVPITRDMDVALVAKLAEVSLEDFKSLNPSLRRPVIMAAGTPQILLPWDNAEIFQRNLASRDDPAAMSNWTTWTAPSTMKPAEAAQTVGMSEEELRRINNIPANVLIKAGSALLVPRSDQVKTDISSSVAEKGQMALMPEVVTVIKRSTVRARKGDSVASLAQRYGVTAGNLAEWNHISASGSLKKGQAVTLLLPSKVKASVAAAADNNDDTSPRRGSSKASGKAGKAGKSSRSEAAPKRGGSSKAAGKSAGKPARASAPASKPARKKGH